MAKRFALIGLFVTAGLLSTNTVVKAQSNINGTDVNTVTTAVPFLRISPDARAGAMGDVGIATSADPNAQHWNVAKIPFADKKYGVSATYTPWLKDLVPDIFLAYLSGYAKFGENDNQALSMSLRYFSLGEINYTDVNAQPIGTGNPNEFAIDLGYSRKLSENLSTGLSFRFINSAIASGLAAQPGTNYKPGTAFGADLGVYYNKKKEISDFQSTTLNFGAVLSNVGSKISYTSTRRDFIPINLGLGGAYTYQADAYNAITIALDINKLLVPTPLDSNTEATDPTADYYIPEKSVVSGMLGSFGDAPGGFREELREYQISVGAEYWYQQQFAVRAGYFYENKYKGDRQYFTVGLGVRYNVFNLNFAYLIPSGNGLNRNPLSNTLRFSLLFEFDKLEKKDSDVAN